MTKFDKPIISKMIVVIIDPRNGNQSDFIFDCCNAICCSREEYIGRSCEEAAHRLFLRGKEVNEK